MIAQDFIVHDKDKDGEGEMKFLLLFYKEKNIITQTDGLAIRYGASISVYEGLKWLSQQKS